MADKKKIAGLFMVLLMVLGLALYLDRPRPGEKSAAAAPPALVKRLLQEVNEHFTIQGKPVHPLLVEKFQTFLSDSGPPAVITVDLLAATRNGNEYYVPDVKVQDGLVSYRIQEGSGFAYKWLGTVRPGLHVVETLASGGGTGIFMDLYFFRIYASLHRAGMKKGPYDPGLDDAGADACRSGRPGRRDLIKVEPGRVSHRELAVDRKTNSGYL